MSTNGMTEAADQTEPGNSYDGMFFIGTVVDNVDPQQAERLRIRIPNLFGEETPDNELPWARPVKHRIQGPKQGVGTVAVPLVGSKMVVILQGGNPYSPLYLGGLMVAAEVPAVLKTNYPQRYGLVDERQNEIWVDTNTGDAEFKHYSGLKAHVFPNGKLEITGPNDLVMTFAGNGTLTIEGNLSMTVNGNTTLNAGGTVDVTASGTVTVVAPDINLN